MAYTTIDKPTDYFNTVLYTGNDTGSTGITGVGFQPDWVWIKSRNGAYDHNFFDSVRGAEKQLVANGTNAEQTLTDSFNSFDSDGFTLGADSQTDGVNNNGTTYVSWNWLASNTTASNTDGGITSTVSASTTSGFSIVSFTGTGSNATVGHGLGTAPSMVIIKRRDSANDWRVGSDGLANYTKHINLNTTAAESDLAAAFNSTAPTSSVFNVGTSISTNASSGTFIAYCFASIKGFSKIGGNYKGNGDSDGPFVYLGFKPAVIIIKRIDSSGNNWRIHDNKRLGYNGANNELYPNATGTEGPDRLDLLSNGIKITTTDASYNASGGTYIYMAFAESPFVNSNGVPNNAR